MSGLAGHAAKGGDERLFVLFFALLRNFTLSGLLAFALSPLVAFLCGLENMEVVAASLLAILVLLEF